MKINNLVHYIWVGNNTIPDHFKENLEHNKKLNPEYEFVEWTDDTILESIPGYEDEYLSSTNIYNKLQIARYMIADQHGGMVCDYDIQWKLPLDDLYEWFCHPYNLIFPYRNGLLFYNRGKKTTFVDDFMMITRPGFTGKFLEYCKKEQTPDYCGSHYNTSFLGVWLFTQENVKYIYHKMISEDPNSIFAVHDNKRTWQS